MHVTEAGLICAVGLDAPSACAAIRANISGFADLPYHDNQGEPIVGAAVPDLDPELKREERILRLLEMGIADLLGRVKLPPGSVPLFVGLAEPDRPGGSGGLAGRVVELLRERLPIQPHSASRAFPTGHTAGLEGLRAARELLRAGAVPACVVCAADSFANAASLLWLDRHHRLKTPENSDGVIPGEAGAAILLTAAPPAGPAVRVRGLGFAEEKAHVLTDEPLLGLGMAAAARQALAEANLGMHEIDFRLSDVAGEQYGFKELALAQQRLMRQRREEQTLWHPAEAVGDTGAASGLVGMAVLREAFAKNYTPGVRVMMTAASAGGDRAAAVLEG